MDGKCQFIDTDTTGRCEQGNNPSDTGHQWVCEGIHGGADAPCTQGLCGIVQDTCIAGTFQDALNDKWHCLGNHHIAPYQDDDDPDCVDEVDPAECAYDAPGNCITGNPIGNTSPWACEGNNPDSTSDDVECVIGVCGTSDNCDAGQYVDGPGETWECKGNHPTAGITADDVMCTPSDPQTCDFGSIDLDQNALTPPAACVPAACRPDSRPPGSWNFSLATSDHLNVCSQEASCLVAGGQWVSYTDLNDPNLLIEYCSLYNSPIPSMWNGWDLFGKRGAPWGLLELDRNTAVDQDTFYCAGTCDAVSQTCHRGGIAYGVSCVRLHSSGGVGIPHVDVALSQQPQCAAAPPDYCAGGITGSRTDTATGSEWRCHGAGYPSSSVDCGYCDPDHGYEGNWPNCTQIQGTGTVCPPPYACVPGSWFGAHILNDPPWNVPRCTTETDCNAAQGQWLPQTPPFESYCQMVNSTPWDAYEANGPWCP